MIDLCSTRKRITAALENLHYRLSRHVTIDRPAIERGTDVPTSLHREDQLAIAENRDIRIVRHHQNLTTFLNLAKYADTVDEMKALSRSSSG